MSPRLSSTERARRDKMEKDWMTRPPGVVPFPTEYCVDDDSDRDYHVPSCDSKGHYERIVVKIPPSLESALVLLVQTKRVPYRSPLELIRHAIVLHLRSLESSMTEEILTDFTQFEAASMVVRFYERQEAFEDSLNRLEGQVNRMVVSGYREEVISLLEDYRSKIDCIPSDGRREMYLAEFDRKYGALLAQDD